LKVIYGWKNKSLANYFQFKNNASDEKGHLKFECFAYACYEVIKFDGLKFTNVQFIKKMFRLFLKKEAFPGQ
jgi:hypothetical protein